MNEHQKRNYEKFSYYTKCFLEEFMKRNLNLNRLDRPVTLASFSDELLTMGFEYRRLAIDIEEILENNV